MSVQAVETVADVDEIEWEIAELAAEYGSDRAALRETYRTLKSVLADADRATSRGYLRGLFSEGKRPEKEPAA